MQSVFGALVRMVLVVAGLLFAACLLVVMVMLMAVWGLRAVWARLTGQAFSPFEMRLDPRTGFRYVYRRGSRPHHGAAQAQAGEMHPSGVEPGWRRRLATDVTDVQPKPTTQY